MKNTNTPELTTLCYIEKDDCYLMLHRVSKENDINKDKWIGVGGHLEADESPEECLLREVKEETGLTLTSFRYRATITFISGDGCTEYMALYTADGFTGEVMTGDEDKGADGEGILEWIPKSEINNLNLWEGDRIFFRLLEDRDDFFSLKLVYNGHGVLTYAAVDGKPMELLDIIEEDGSKTGIVRERNVAHRYGSMHATVHMWVMRRKEKNAADAAGKSSSYGISANDPAGEWEVLLQKRSANKDSNPGCYDISSAGHISAGNEPLPSAVREIGEELGIRAVPEDFLYVGTRIKKSNKEFYGKPFIDNQLSYIYIYRGSVDTDLITLQEEEVESVEWMALDEVIRRLDDPSFPNCIYLEELDKLKAYLAEHPGCIY
ncbi:MAG TPA: DNA mismatch repair protein MutT [Lachnospiraceae bacterium]|nr:DNA mismatch repair protein MutT [Lachnospiraceae bacterium]